MPNWLSIKQIRDLVTRLGVSGFPKTDRRIRDKADRENWQSRPRTGRGGGREYHISSLPPEIRQGLKHQNRDNIIQDAMEDLKKRQICISPDALQKKRNRTMARIYAQMQVPPEGIGKDEWVGALAKTVGKHKATLYRWEQKIRRDGGIRTPRKNLLDVEIRSRSFDPAALDWAVGTILNNPRITTRHVYERLLTEATARGWTLGSEKTFYRLMKQIPEPLRRYSVAGRKGLEWEMPRISTDHTVFHVLERLVGDQHLFDYQVYDDDMNTVTPVCYAWVDLRSRFFPGVYPALSSYNAYDVGMSLRYACQYGVPREIYTDNGKPELSGHVARIRQQLDGMTAFHDTASLERQLNPDGVIHRKARVKNPQSKIIEPLFWHAFEANLIKYGLPGYSKRAQDDLTNDQLRKDLAREARTGKLLHYKEFFTEVHRAVSDWNSHMMSAEEIIPEVFFFDCLEEAPVMQMDEKTLDFLFLPVKQRIVRQSKVRMTLPGHGACTFYARELFPLSRPARKQGIRVEVRYNPYDASKVYIVDEKTRGLICIAERWDKVNPKKQEELTPKYKAQWGVVMHWERLARKYAAKVKKVHRFSPYAKAAKQVADLEAMRKRKPTDRSIDKALLESFEEYKRQQQHG